jgi:hypothetical protein
VHCGKLEQLKARRELWIRCLDGNDRHSIMRQITRMVWNTAAFRVVNEARRIAPPAQEGGVQRNGLMHRLLDDGFFAGQMLAIRRLTDAYPIVGDPRNRAVFSLTSLLDDMRKHAHLMTRANVLAAEGLEYSADPQDFDCYAELRHADIDALAGVAPENRCPEDAVRPEVMAHLKRKLLAACKDLHVHVDKFIAHAATPESRQAVAADTAAITLNHLYVAHEAICKVANFVDVYLLTGTSHGMLAVPQYNHFAYLDRPLVSREGISILRQTWDAYDKETHDWTLWGLEELRQEFST